MKKRGVLYLYWGEAPALDRSMQSLADHHPELPVHMQELDRGATLLDKASMLRRSPFEETLFLDIDTVVMGRLDFGFAMAARHSLACCICECPWAARYGGLRHQIDLVEYNTGVLFFTKAAAPVFDAWEAQVRTVDSSIQMEDGKGGVARMPYNDQAAFALAVAEMGSPPFILPLNWNFRPAWHRSWWGPLKIWHDYNDPTPAVLEEQQRQVAPGALIRYRQFGP